MPRKVPTPEVEVRSTTPELASEEEQEKLLYRPVENLDIKPNWRTSYEWINAKTAEEWLEEAGKDETFRNRPLIPSQVRRWGALMSSDRFVHFLPNGVIVRDPNGVMLNGYHRFQAIAGMPHRKRFGFMVVHDVPRWMFKFFDTNKVKTVRDVLYSAHREFGPQTPTAMRLGMRYEEFMMGLRPATGWRHWNTVKDEPSDIDDFVARRTELNDWYGVGEKVNRAARLLVPSVMVFRFYQSLAWPEGDEEITGFCESLITGANLTALSSTLHLREWARDAWYNKDRVPAKRETHLFLQMKAFKLRDSRIQKMPWAYGMPMEMPYHPKGWETGLENIKKALAEMDTQA